MSNDRVPPAFSLLARQRNLAVAPAVLEALPHLAPELRAAALGVIIEQDDPTGLGLVIGGFNGFSAAVQALVLERLDAFFAGVRLAVFADSVECRTSAIAVIARADDGRLAYLLADALRGPCPTSREHAADALHDMAERQVDRLCSATSPKGAAAIDAQSRYLEEELAKAVTSWEAHFQLKTLCAAMWLGEHVGDAIERKLRDPRTKMARAAETILERTHDARLAGFLLLAHAMPALQSVAADTVAQTRHTDLVLALAAQSWLLADPEIRKQLRRIRRFAWLDDGVGELLGLPEGEAIRIIRLLGATGVRAERKVELFEQILNTDNAALCDEVVWQLVSMADELATELLMLQAQRGQGRAARIAAREVRRRRPDMRAEEPPAWGDTNGEPSVWERLWADFDRLTPDQRRILAATLGEGVTDLLVPLTARLASDHALFRVRALRIVGALGFAPELSETIHRLAHDPDSVVRGCATALLATLPGVTSARILRDALNDPNDRVQANAIDAMDAMGLTESAPGIESKLASPNSRVRANAVKALLQIELRKAGDVLLDMLEDTSNAQRLSALWVVERLQLETVWHRIRSIANEDPDHRVRQRALRVLRRLQDAQSTITDADARSSALARTS